MRYLAGFMVTGLVAGVFGWWLLQSEPVTPAPPSPRLSTTAAVKKIAGSLSQADWIQKVRSARKEDFSVLLVRISHLTNESLKQELADSLLDRWNVLPPEDFQSFRSLVEGADQGLLELLKGAVLRNQEFRGDFIEMFARSLAAAGPEPAAVWAVQFLAQGRDNFACRELGVAWAKENPKAGLTLLGSLTATEVARQMALEIGNSMQVSTLEEMDELAATLEGPAKEAFCEALLSHSLEHMDQAALTSRLGHTEPTALMSKVAARYAEKDPQQAFQWIAQFQSESCKTAAAQTIFESWSREHSSEALRYLKESYPDSPFLIESIVAGALKNRHDSEAAWQLLRELPDGEWMSHGLQALYSALPTDQAAEDFKQMMSRETNPRVRASGLAYLAQLPNPTR